MALELGRCNDISSMAARKGRCEYIMQADCRGGGRRAGRSPEVFPAIVTSYADKDRTAVSTRSSSLSCHEGLVRFILLFTPAAIDVGYKSIYLGMQRLVARARC